jgi:twitching motility protein PilT
VLVGELRDYETISIAVTGGRDGHPRHGHAAHQRRAQTVDRMINVFPADNKATCARC